MAEFTGLIGTPSGGFTLKVVYSTVFDSSQNNITVNATGYVKRNNSSYYPSSSYATASMTIDGDTKLLSGSVYYNLDTDDYDQIITHSKTVSLGSATSKTFSISLSFDGNRSSYYPNGSVSQDITVSRSSYTISYDMNGGSGSISSQTKYHGISLTLSNTVPTQKGYTFSGWKSSDGTVYSSGGSYTANKSDILYAQWTPNRLTISYNVNSGSIGNEAFLSNSDGIITSSEEPHVIFQEFFYNDTLSEGLLTHDYFSLYKNGYKFIGWSLDKNDNLNLFDETKKDYIVSQFSKEIENGEVNVTLYAQWEIQNIAYLKINGKYSLCLTYLKINNTWTPCIAYIKTNGVYKQSIV